VERQGRFRRRLGCSTYRDSRVSIAILATAQLAPFEGDQFGYISRLAGCWGPARVMHPRPARREPLEGGSGANEPS
jgi:hypothetical protein